MVMIYKNDLVRDVKESKVEAYLSAGWATKAEPKGKKVLVEEPVVLIPTIEANPIVISDVGDANNSKEI